MMDYKNMVSFIRQNYKTIQNGNKVTVNIDGNMNLQQQYKEISNKLEYLLLLGIINDMYCRLENEMVFNHKLNKETTDKVFEIIYNQVWNLLDNDVYFNECLYDCYCEIEKEVKKINEIKKELE